MSHYVYIIYSIKSDIYYKGESEDYMKRVSDHNDDLSEYTRGKGPWQLVYATELPDRKTALRREKQIKRLNRRSIEKLLTDRSNMLLS